MLDYTCPTTGAFRLPRSDSAKLHRVSSRHVIWCKNVLNGAAQKFHHLER